MRLNLIKSIPERAIVRFNTPKAKPRIAPKFCNEIEQNGQKQSLSSNISKTIKSGTNENQNQPNPIRIMDIYESFMPQVTEDDTVQSYFEQ